MVGRGAQEPLVVRVAAHDSIEDDHIGGLHASWIHCDVVKQPLCAYFDARLAHEPHCLVVVAGRELEVRRARRATLQELDLHVADSAADFQDGRPLDAVLLEEREHSLRGLVDALLPIALGRSARHARGEELVTAPRVAATRHVRAAYGRLGPGRAALAIHLTLTYSNDSLSLWVT